MTDDPQPSGPDLSAGVSRKDFKDSKLLGHVGGDEVLLVELNNEILAIDAHCSHYHGPLAEGVVIGDEVRCPWHHACFNLRTGEANCAPAIQPLNIWKVEIDSDAIRVRSKAGPGPARRVSSHPDIRRIVIVGGGAAGFAAAEMLRRRGFDGDVTMLSNDAATPVDRPNLSKDYLAGSAPEEWLPLQPDDFYKDKGIGLRLNTEVAALDPARRCVTLQTGEAVPYDRLLLATGAEPVRPDIPGATPENLLTLRSVADCKRIVARIEGARRVVVLGASFIGLEVAASLRTRGVEVHVVAPEARPMERVLGGGIGDAIRAIHEQNGVVFHLGETVAQINGRIVTLKSGQTLEADFVVAGVGVRPRVALAEQAGLKTDRGVIVDAHLQTSVPGIFAAGDIARWPDRHSGQLIRVEHWVVAERQGQAAAINLMGEQEPFNAVPFFWSQHYDMTINYVGHAEHWDEADIEGDIAARDCVVRYRLGHRTMAVASIGRDLDSLRAELAFERGIEPATA
jgi:NADPH-dependent 2,4-dienoyl-CoA reductase/sulfur reductase-like enzyme/nitrite reductase/ring-hydroxylating ferredoxin subunit